MNAEEILLPGPAIALSGLLGTETLRDASAGDPLPPTWHGVFLPDRPRQADIGADGHPVRGTLIVPPAGLRRMFAGGRVRGRERALRLGEAALRSSSATEPVTKQGRGGPLRFVTVTHEYRQAGGLALVDEQQVVYLEATRPSPGPVAPRVSPPVPRDPGGTPAPVDPTVLFRFSALTYNSHRIHYDRDYAAAAEGYAGLVVHGPLQALWMAEAIRLDSGLTAPYDFSYRLVAPLLEHQGPRVSVSRTGSRQWTASVADDAGRTTATATMSYAG
jgi:3-methylfumaryl-CoA hydratase